MSDVILHEDKVGVVWRWVEGELFAQAWSTMSAAMIGNVDAEEYMTDYAAQMDDEVPFTPASLQEKVAEFYLANGTEQEKRAYGVDVRPYSVCIHCRRLIYWNAEYEWWDDDTLPPSPAPAICDMRPDIRTEDRMHVARWLTLAEFRARTAHLPDWFPVTLDGQGESGVPHAWYNVRLPEVPTMRDLEDDRPASLLLDIVDDFDTRQW